MQTVADSSSAQNMSHLGLTMSSPCVGGGGEPPIVLRMVVWWCAGWWWSPLPAAHHSYLPPFHSGPGQHNTLARGQWAYSGNHAHCYTQVQVCTSTTVLTRQVSPGCGHQQQCLLGELRPAWPRGHCHHIFEHFNHSYPATTTTTTSL